MSTENTQQNGREKGMTLKQWAIHDFYQALEYYKTCLRSGNGIVGASLRIHSAKGNVPKRFHHLVGKAFKAKGQP